MNTVKGFGSDNHSGIHPLFLEAMIKANQGHAPSYGTDDITLKAIKQIQQAFGQDQADVHFVFNGTAANVLCLKAAMQRHQSLLCTDTSHINMDECGAPEFFAGKVITIPSCHGKFIFEEIEKHLIRKGDQHYSQPKVISLTQPTELGTCYSVEEVKKIVGLAKKHNLFVHVDGARLANACYTLHKSFKELTTDLGVDIVSLGGTKNGLSYGEAIVILNSELKNDFKFIKKQAAQLPSKSRFITTQFLAYFENNTYLKIAQHACEMARLLRSELQKLGLAPNYDSESNAVFVNLPKNVIKPLRQKYFFYVWNEQTFECRLMTSWDTEESEVLSFVEELKNLLTRYIS